MQKSENDWRSICGWSKENLLWSKWRRSPHLQWQWGRSNRGWRGKERFCGIWRLYTSVGINKLTVFRHANKIIYLGFTVKCCLYNYKVSFTRNVKKTLFWMWRLLSNVFCQTRSTCQVYVMLNRHVDRLVCPKNIFKLKWRTYVVINYLVFLRRSSNSRRFYLLVFLF